MQINTKECGFFSGLFDEKPIEFKKEMALHAINKYLFILNPELNQICYDELPKVADFFLDESKFKYTFYKQDNFVVCICHGLECKEHPYILGVSKCNVIDKFNLKTGMWLAFKRCIYNSMRFYDDAITLPKFFQNCNVVENDKE